MNAERDAWFAEDTTSETGLRRDRHLVAGLRPATGTVVVTLCCRSVIVGAATEPDTDVIDIEAAGPGGPEPGDDTCRDTAGGASGARRRIGAPGFRLCWECAEVAAGRRPPPPNVLEFDPVRLVRLRSGLVSEQGRLVHVCPPPDPGPALLRARCGAELAIVDLDILDVIDAATAMPCGVCLAASLMVMGAEGVAGTAVGAAVSRRLGGGPRRSSRLRAAGRGCCGRPRLRGGAARRDDRTPPVDDA
ncbi:hypothetical protein FHR81_001837 [Actinoalloteichus hoggarensis]|uniref:Uncharacterized protein n=1 Tax=Actinoalloteichus hoggarensis TaxID=1470176 RepID=A0A221W4U6_9PSEU|nr:hypothetical protein [Actinoalloteichus hoggarensis]ASO20868.1 hypothetical protein AHOG_16210 [Actinoalloteichus hoggarensis]MBB5920799.1 hypothetical protein [Actinoalloteichus hoggarensis]